MKNLPILLSLALLSSSGIAAKKALDHDAFDSWQRVFNYQPTRNGEWTAFAENAQEGDGVLTFYNTKTRKKIEIPRGYKSTFTADGRWGLVLVKPLFQETRDAKIKKKKDFDLPQDSLAIVDLSKGTVEKIPSVISYSTGKDGGEWVAWTSCDTTLISPTALKDKKAGRPMVIRHLPSKASKTVKWVKDFSFSKDGSKIAFTQKKHKSDSIATDGVGYVSLPDTTLHILDSEAKHYGVPVFDEAGKHLAFTLSKDSAESGTRRYSLFMVDINDPLAEPVLMLEEMKGNKGPNLMRPHSDDPEQQEKLLKAWEKAMKAAAGKELFVNQYSKPVFSHNGRRLVIGVAPEIAPDDTTIVDFERANLDIWRWDAPYTPPMENKNVNKLREKTFPVVIDLAGGSRTLLNTDPLCEVSAPDRWDADWALVHDPNESIVSFQWDYLAPVDMALVNVNNGERRAIGKANRDDGVLSPAGKYVLWFKDRQYHCYDIATGKTAVISDKITYPLWEEDDDHPMEVGAYGVAAWSENDDALLVYDRYDIWSLDPKGVREPVNLTAGYGRKSGLRFRFEATDPEFRALKPGEEMLLRVFNYDNKRHGLATMKYGKAANPVVRTLEENTFTQIRKAVDAPVYSWQKSNFSTSPNIYVCRGLDFAKAEKVSDANPQMKDYSWGDAQLVRWYSYSNRLTDGVLYTPEDLDPEKKYPMLVVFYETNSEELYRHYVMEPSWSWVNYPFYVSRGYVVFVPDIHYTPGVPGENAYDYVCSGVEELCRRYPWIDKDKIGIDGQSWGGYQTAYLVTRTNMFACAGSGAPVANMTSAFGGIRWESGDSRQAQYEMGQSRIGRNLWEAPALYLANSPVFYADRVETPLLIMHNDADGAVPWYQGIEMFMALRRLQKPVWMLQYNSEAHNLRERRNRKDITIRLQQFFDHYLKDAPMPEWMKNGIPAVRKGQEFGTALTE